MITLKLKKFIFAPFLILNCISFCYVEYENLDIELATLKSELLLSDPASSFDFNENLGLPHEEKRIRYAVAREEYDRAKNKHEDRIQGAICRLAGNGDTVLDLLLEEYKKDHSELSVTAKTQYKRNIILTLGKINSKRSQEALFLIAQGKLDSIPSATAARTYIENLQNKSDAIELLENQYIRSAVLRSLRGSVLDQTLYKKCDALLSSDEYELRIGAAYVLCSDNNANLAQEKIDSLVQSLATVKQIPHSNRKFQQSGLGTKADNVYAELTRAMMNVVGLNSSHLRPHLNSLDGKARFCIEIVLAHLTDIPIKEALKKDIQDVNSGTVLRLLALEKFENIVSQTEEDKCFLTEISRHDPLLVYDLGGPLYEIVNSDFFVSPHIPIDGAVEEDKECKKLIEDEILNRASLGRQYYIIRQAAESLLNKHFEEIK
jgi:hypothetical protein